MDTYLVDILLPANELLPLPTRQHAELRTDEANLACPSPGQGWGSTEGDEFLEFLDHMS